MTSPNETSSDAALPPAVPPERAWLHYLIVALVAGVVAFWNLSGGTLEEHEAKAALGAMGMLDMQRPWMVQGAIPGPLPDPSATPSPLLPIPNRWLVPVNNGQPRLVKTPLQYWLIAAAFRLTGRTDEFSVRLASAVSAVLCCLITLAIGRRMLGSRAALLGALMLATSVAFDKWGRNGRPELTLCLFMTAGMAAFWMGLEARTRLRRAGWMIAFWGLMGLANLSKEFVPLLAGVPLLAYLCWRQNDGSQNPGVATGDSRWRLAIYGLVTLALILANGFGLFDLKTLAWWRLAGLSDTLGKTATMGLIVLAPLAWYCLATRGWRQIIRVLPTAVPGIVLMLALFVPWMWYMRQLFPGAGDIFNEQVTERAAGTGALGNEGPFGYVLPLVLFVLPWIVMLPGGFAVAWLRRFANERRPLMYLFLWTAGVLAMLTLAAGKKEHYILPIMPALFLLMGFAADDLVCNHRWLNMRLGQWAVGGMAAGVAIAAPAGWVAWAFMRNGAYGWPMLHMAAVMTVAAVPAAVALVLSLNARPTQTGMSTREDQRLSLGMAMLVLASAVGFAGFATRADLWDTRKVITDYALDLRTLAPEGLASYGDPQEQVVYYYGKMIPDMLWLRERETRLNEKKLGLDAASAEADRKWRDAMQSAGPRFITTRDDKEPKTQENIPILRSLGYEIKHTATWGKKVFVLMEKRVAK